MRNSRQMMEMILSAARQDRRVRAVLLNGSRANPNAPRDIFQDFDIVYLVQDMESFHQGGCYVDRFGPRIMLQMPESMRDPIGDGRLTYLTLLADGNRLDLQIVPLERWEQMLGRDSQTIVLLDKDGCLPAFPPASDRDYLPTPPDAKNYFSCCNNFWWCMQNVAKGIWRDELPYAMDMYHRYVRDELLQMLFWRIGQQTNWQTCPGKAGKYMKKYLTREEYELLAATYSDGREEPFWQAVFAMCRLFGQTARQVGQRAGFAYPQEDEEAMTAYLRHVRALPKDAREIYP